MTIQPIVSQYTINAASEPDGINGTHYEIKVDRALQIDGPAKWAVRWMGRCLHRSGRWDMEPLPSSRTDRWLTSHRFDLETALTLAQKAAPELVVNGRRPDGRVS